LRASYGTTGNDQIGNYGYLELWQSAPTYQGVATIAPSRIANPDFAWEINRKLEAALETGFLKDRLMFSISYYQSRSSNQLMNYALPPSTGFPSVQDNLPAKVENTGWELEVTSTNVDKGNFSWVAALNLTIPQNKLLAYPNLEYSADAVNYKVGEPLSILKTYHILGVDPQTGLYVIEDADGDGIISRPNDQKMIKRIGPEYYGGVQNTFKFKGLQLDFLIQFVKQTGNNYMTSVLAPGFGLNNQPAYVLERWKQDGDKYSTTTAGALNYIDARTYGGMSISDASFARLKNLSLSYRLPQKWIAKLNIRELKVYTQGQNLVTITNYKGLDPESQSLLALPPLRMITAGIQFTF
jgi:TonB-dependent starch-binding outer membrane protein SusC